MRWRAFTGFDADAQLIRTMLHSTDSLEVRKQQQPARRAMFQACAANALPGAPPALRRRVAAALQLLYSASAWETLRQFWNMDADEAADVIETAITAMLHGLHDQPHATRAPRIRS